MTDGILIGGNEAGQVFLNPRYANRHGLVAGATGTGKTVTLQCLAEGFSDLGVPVFLADVKGDISGISHRALPIPKWMKEFRKLVLEITPSGATQWLFGTFLGKKAPRFAPQYRRWGRS